jgi:hypothetical protein
MGMVAHRRRDMLRKSKRLCFEMTGSMGVVGAYRFPFGILI